MAGPELTVGQILGSISGIGGVVIGAWTLLGKSKDTTYLRVVADRDRLDGQLKELREQQQATDNRLARVESEMKTLRLDHKVVLDFLRDIRSGVFDWEQIKRRASDLLDRLGDSADEQL
ncbi:hypothetical protein QOL99_00085 [Deinococcus sp. MIMF12]|uniref:Uncharacterized protein n=1 Tax=Deinococcus rhizophilus TaxID=3049544 RepID=A0ABT7JBX9_9DEIO|nr:hypothetical protein [Deinococcus rhizophilus]MDL2342546.1 hypothetical protein [Deinococcus rhizophilus]